MEEKTKIERKNNKSVKTAVLLFGAVLITMSLLGGTLAKYTSDIGTAKDEARVAKWGITKQTDKVLDMFDTSYKDPSDTNVTVKSNTTSKVIAPGTKGEVEVFPSIPAAELTNVETAFTVEYSYGAYKDDSVYAKYSGNWSNGTFPWWPLRFTVSKWNGATYDTPPVYDGISRPGDDGDVQYDGLNDAITALNASSATIYPEDTLTEKQDKLNNMKFKIEWEWPFSRGTAEDGWDTTVGDRAAGLTDSDPDMPKFNFSMSYKAVQVD